MRNHFFEQYKYSESEKNSILSDCIFVFDTNILLNLYRYTAETRNKMLDVMKTHKNRIWIPYQVGWEFFNNRNNVIEEVKNFPSDIKKQINDFKNKIVQKCNEKKHPHISGKDIEHIIDSFVNKITSKIDKQTANLPNYNQDDLIWSELSNIFDGKVGDDFDENTLEKIYNEGQKRYENKIPPGFGDFKDKQHSDKRILYGDLVLWKQIIEEAKNNQKNVVFVTEDVSKDDWFQPVKQGETKSGRVELVKEFHLETNGMKFLLYNQDCFLYDIDKYLGTKITKAAQNEIREVAEHEAKKIKDEQKSLTREQILNPHITNYNPFRVSLSDAAKQQLWTNQMPHDGMRVRLTKSKEDNESLLGIPLNPLSDGIVLRGNLQNTIIANNDTPVLRTVFNTSSLNDGLYGNAFALRSKTEDELSK